MVPINKFALISVFPALRNRHGMVRPYEALVIDVGSYEDMCKKKALLNYPDSDYPNISIVEINND